MSAPPSWEGLLRTPHPCDHLVQLYTDDAFLSRAVSLFIGLGLADGEAAVIIATPEHVELFKKSLRAAGLDVAALVEREQFVLLDATTCLAEFMVDGMPDRDKFVNLVMPVFARTRADGYERIRLYGEMVNLLWDHNLPGTVARRALEPGARRHGRLPAVRLQHPTTSTATPTAVSCTRSRAAIRTSSPWMITGVSSRPSIAPTPTCSARGGTRAASAA